MTTDAQNRLDALPGLKEQITEVIAHPERAHPRMKDYERVYEDFWKDVLENLDGTLNVDAVKKELFDWYFAMGEVAEVYCHITNGVLSKPNYYASSVIAVADEYVDRLIAEALEDAEDAQGQDISD